MLMNAHQRSVPGDSPDPPPRRFSWGGLAFLVVLIVVLAALATPVPFKALERAKLAEHLNNGKQVKLALDVFAMDHVKHYPDGETTRWFDLPRPETSNDYFRQLFAAEVTRSERIFWIMDHRLCVDTAPDDVTGRGGAFDPAATLQPGDNGWAYVLDQTSEGDPDRPLLFDSPPTAAGLNFDTKLWDDRVVVIRIDSTARPERLTPDGRLLDDNGVELLSPASAVWNRDPVEIAYPQAARQ